MGGGCGGGGGKGGLPNWKGSGGRIPSSAARLAVARTGAASRRTVRVPPRAFTTSSRQQQHSGTAPVHVSEFTVLGLSPLASRSDVKHAYKRLALKYHPDVAARSSAEAAAEAGAQCREDTFREIKSAYESLMLKFEAEAKMEAAASCSCYAGDEWEEWDEWMGFEGGVPMVYHPAT